MSTFVITQESSYCRCVKDESVYLSTIDTVLEELWLQERFNPIIMILNPDDHERLLNQIIATTYSHGTHHTSLTLMNPYLASYINPITGTVILVKRDTSLPQGTFKLWLSQVAE